MRAITRQLFVGLLLAGAVLVQMLGILHHAAHGQPEVGDGVPPPTNVQAVAKAFTSDADSWLAKLFSGHQQDSPDCRVIDQLGHTDILFAVPALPIVCLPPPSVAPALPSAFVARWPALFDARGPPAFR